MRPRCAIVCPWQLVKSACIPEGLPDLHTPSWIPPKRPRKSSLYIDSSWNYHFQVLWMNYVSFAIKFKSFDFRYYSKTWRQQWSQVKRQIDLQTCKVCNLFNNNSPVHCVPVDTREIGWTRKTHKQEIFLDMICGQRRILNAISACAGVPVKAPLLPGGHLQAILLLTSPNCLASSALFPQDRLQHHWENHRLYLVQH